MSARRWPRAVAGLWPWRSRLRRGAPPCDGRKAAIPSGECPPILPLDEVSTGMRGTAVSVTQGRTLSTFGAEVLGILRTRSARGATSSSSTSPGRRHRCRRAVGRRVGSPVFLRTGSGESSGGRDRLRARRRRLDAGRPDSRRGHGAAARHRERLCPDDREGSEGARSAHGRASGLSVTQTATISRLKTPLSVGADGQGHQMQAIDRQGLPFIAYMGSSAPADPPPPSGSLRAGDSFAAAMSVGTSVAGIGTTVRLRREGRRLRAPVQLDGRHHRHRNHRTIRSSRIRSSAATSSPTSPSVGTLAGPPGRDRRRARHRAGRLPRHVHRDRPRPGRTARESRRSSPASCLSSRSRTSSRTSTSPSTGSARAARDRLHDPRHARRRRKLGAHALDACASSSTSPSTRSSRSPSRPRYCRRSRARRSR